MQLPKHKAEATSFMKAWVQSLPLPEEMVSLHPVLCKEEDQDALKASTAKKIYRALDDIEEDANWFEERVWSTDRGNFPSSVTLNGEEYPCFTPEEFAWVFLLVTSRSAVWMEHPASCPL